jgi:hypothetical protein
MIAFMRGESKLEGSICVVCGHPMHVRIVAWSARCEQCETWISDLPLGGTEVHSDCGPLDSKPYGERTFA